MSIMFGVLYHCSKGFKSCRGSGFEISEPDRFKKTGTLEVKDIPIIEERRLEWRRTDSADFTG
ncbi:MAG: hypothetical protein IMY87_02605 [Chloroflexi bacterium]|nr:hypothetical protein [Chloroflexota bacterium]